MKHPLLWLGAWMSVLTFELDEALCRALRDTRLYQTICG
jgi:hypothetical protein